MIPNEALIRSGRALYLRSNASGDNYDCIEGRLYLTNCRVWFEPSEITGDALRTAYASNGALKPTSLPIFHIAKPGTRKVQGAPVLRLGMADDGREYFQVKNVALWQQGIAAAKPSAPELPLTRPSTLRHGVDYKGHLIRAWLRFGVTLLIIGAALAYFEPIWRPHVPRMIAWAQSLLKNVTSLLPFAAQS